VVFPEAMPRHPESTLRKRVPSPLTKEALNRAPISRKRGDFTCDVCLLLNLGLLTEEMAQIVVHPYFLCVPAW
jgi:hypothetical protein